MLCLVVYFISDYFFTDAMLYVTGGLIGGTIKELFKGIGFVAKGGIIIFIWLVLLAAIVILFYRVHNKSLKYILLLTISCLLYIVDFTFIEIIKFNIEDAQTGNLNIALRVITKALVLASIVYLEQRRSINRTAT